MLMFYLSLIPEETGKEKFVIIYENWRDLMFYTADRVLKDDFLSEDAVQDAFLYIARHIDKIDDPKSLSTRAYLRLLTDSCAKKILRERKEVVNQDLFEGFSVDVCDVEDRFFEQYGVEQLQEKIQSLPELYRTPMLLKYMGGHKTDEIADIMGIRPDAVRKRLERARGMLRAALEKEGLTV